jgi:hypothetical protein
MDVRTGDSCLPAPAHQTLDEGNIEQASSAKNRDAITARYPAPGQSKVFFLGFSVLPKESWLLPLALS